jgi:hypothetical protein
MKSSTAVRRCLRYRIYALDGGLREANGGGGSNKQQPVVDVNECGWRLAADADAHAAAVRCAAVDFWREELLRGVHEVASHEWLRA